MIGWLWRVITGRGEGPSRNRSLSREAQREQIVRATLDLWRVPRKRDKVEQQIDRFEAMSRGYDGGPLKEGSSVSIRKAHYKGWRDRDFNTLIQEIREKIAHEIDLELEAARLEGRNNDDSSS